MPIATASLSAGSPSGELEASSSITRRLGLHCLCLIPAPRVPVFGSQKMRTAAQSIELLDFRDELLLKIIDCMTTAEGSGGLLLCCRRLSDLARPNVFQKRQKEARAFYLYFLEL